MNKLAYISSIVLAATFAACDNFDLPNPPGQENQEPVIFESSNLAIAQGPEALDLKAANNEGVRPVVANITKLEGLSAPYSVAFELEMSNTEDFEKVVTVSTIVDGDNIVVTPDVVNGLIYSNFTRDPKTLTVYGRIAAFAVNEGGNVKTRLGGTDDYYYGEGYVYTVTPFDPATVIEDQYYLVGNFCNWDVTKGYPVNQVIAGSPYDQPVFNVKIDIDEKMIENGGFEWKLVPASAAAGNNWAGAYGAEGTSTEGTLVASAEAKTDAGVIDAVGQYLIEFNLLEKTYKIGFAYDFLYAPALGNTTTTDFTKIARLYTNDYNNYKGVVQINRQFWLTCQPSNTSGVIYRPDGDSETNEVSHITTGKMKVDPESTDRMKVPGYQLYFLDVNLLKLQWSATPVNVINVIGAFNGWNVEETDATAMAPDTSSKPANYRKWTSKEIRFNEPGEYKFCVNNAWNISFGGEEGNIVENGGNLVMTEAGTYVFTLDFTTSPYSLQIVKK